MNHVTPRKVVDPDRISIADAARILGRDDAHVRWLRRHGLLTVHRGRASLSRSEVEAMRADPWITGAEAASLLGVSHVRVSQLAATGRIPVHLTTRGKRVYRRNQLAVVANARRERFKQR